MTKPVLRALAAPLSGAGRGRAFGAWLGRRITLPQLRRMSLEQVPWTPFRRSLAEATVSLVTTSGTHLAADHPFDLAGDATFRVIPGTADADDLTISHLAYDSRDALRDINLVFPLQRLRELEAEGVIGRVASRHYGFGLCREGERLIAPGREVARAMRNEGVDLALLVPA